MKLRLPIILAAALLNALCFYAPQAEANTLNVFILTGQSNSLGAVKNRALTSEQLREFASKDVLFWYRNVADYASNPQYFESTSWGSVAPQNPMTTGSLSMGPEYGFSYMMEKKGWMSSGSDDLAVVKASLNGGEDMYWEKGQIGYRNILETVQKALGALDRNTYTTVNIAGLLYLQGESGVREGRYGAFLANLQKDLSDAGYTGVTVTIDQHSVLGQPAYNPAGSNILKKYVDEHSITSKWVISGDLKDDSPDGGNHFSGASQLTIGARYAYSMALFNGLNVGFVRGQENAALDTAGAWWGGINVLNSLSSNVIEWDLSSSNTTHLISSTVGKTLQVGGIKITDTYISNTTTIIQGGHANSSSNAADGTVLSVGSSGISVGGLNGNGSDKYQYNRNLVLASNLELRANQDWVMSGGSSLTVRGDSADTSSLFNKAVISGSGNVSLKRIAGTEGVATFRVNHADVAGAARTWTLNDMVELQLSKSQAWGNNSFVVADGASSSICDGKTGTGLTVGSLTLGNNSQLFLGGNTQLSHLSLTTGSLTIGTGSVFGMDISDSGNDSLTYSGTTSLSLDGLIFNFNYGGLLDESMKITVMKNAGNLTNFSWNSQVSGSLSSKLELVGGDLVLSFSGKSDVVWAPYSPGCEALAVDNATFNARAKSGITNGTVSTRTNSLAAGSTLTFYYANSGAFTGDVYGVLDGLAYTWAAGNGSGTGAEFNSNTLTGSVFVKVTGDMTGKNVGWMVGCVNGTVTGDVYMEFDAANATGGNDGTLGSIAGTWNAQVNGSLTIVVKSGQHNGIVVAGNRLNTGRSINGGTILTVTGGTFNKSVYAGGTEGTINSGTQFTINGGTFKDDIYAGGSGGTINGGTRLTITGGSFDNTKGIYAGGANGTIADGSLVTLKNINGTNSFASFSGTLSGGSKAGTFTGMRRLVLNNFTASSLSANVVNFDSISLMNGSKTGMTLAKMQVATSLSIGTGCELTLETSGQVMFGAGEANRFSGGGTLVFSAAQNYVVSSRIMAAPASDVSYTGLHLVAGTMFLDTGFIGTATNPYQNAFQIGNLSGAGNILGSYGNNSAGIPYRYLQANQSTDDTLVFSGVFGDSGTSSGPVNRSVGLIKEGKGTLVLTGNNVSPADLCVNGGSLQIGNGGTTGSWSGLIKVGEKGTLIWNRSDAVSVAKAVDVEGTLVQSGSGGLTLASVTGTKGMLNVHDGSSLQVTDISNFKGDLTIGRNSKLTMGGSYTIGKMDSITQFNGGKLELLNAATLNLEGTDIYGTTLNLIGDAKLNVTGVTAFSEGITAANGTLTKEGAGELTLTSPNTSIKNLIVSEGSVRISDSSVAAVSGMITNNGSIYLNMGLTLHSDDVGTGKYRVSQGQLDLGNFKVGGKVEMSSGSLANTSGLAAGSVSVVDFAGGNIDMGGMDGSKLASVNMNGKSGTISNLTGNVDLSGSSINLFMTAANMGTMGTGVILFQNPSSSSLTVGDMTLTLGADAVGMISNENATYQFAVTNGSLSGDKSKVMISEYNGDMNWEVTGVGPNGFVTVQFTQGGVIEVPLNTSETYKSGVLKKAPSVINNGSLAIDFSDIAAGQPKETLVKYLTGTSAGAIINTGTDSAASVNFSNGAIADVSEGHTAYAGSISGKAQIVKSGDARLTVDGSVSGQSLTVKDGELVLKGVVDLGGDLVHEKGILTASGKTTIGGNFVVQQGLASLNGVNHIKGNMTVQSGTVSLKGASAIDGSMTLSDGSLSIGANSSVSGMLMVNTGKTLTIENGATLTVGNLSGKGIVSLDHSGLSVAKASPGDVVLDMTLAGNGIFSLSNCNLTLSDDSVISEEISLAMKGGSLDVNGKEVTLSSFDNLSRLDLGTGGTVILGAERGTNLLSGSVEGNGIIEVTGKGTQTIHSAGNSVVDILQRAQGGTLVLEALDPSSSFKYRHLEIGVGDGARDSSESAVVSVLNNASFDSLDLLQNGKLLLGGANHERAVTVSLNNAGTAAEFQSGTTIGITVDRDGVDAGMNSGTWAYIKAGAGSIELSGNFPLNINLYGLGSYGDWSILPTFDVNILYAENGLIMAGAPGSSWTADQINLQYAGFANIVFDIETSVVGGKLLTTHFESHVSNPFLSYSTDDNQVAAANALWKAATHASSLGQEMLEFTNSMGDALRAGSTSDIQQGLSSFAGSGITSLHAAQKGAMQSQVLDIRNRVSRMGLSPDYQYDHLPVFNAWVSGNGGYQKLNDSSDASGYSLNTWGGTAGFDLNCSESVTVGAAFSANYGDLSGYMSSGKLDSYYGNLFFRAQSGRWGHQVILSYGQDDATLNRTIKGPGNRIYSTNGSTDGSSYGAFYEGTYDIYMNEEKTSMFQPMVNASIYQSSISGFTEKGGLGMRVEDMDSTYGKIALGGRLMGVLGSNIFGREVTGECRLLVAQEIGDRRASADVSPVGAPGIGFRVNGSEAGSTAVQVGAGISIPVGYQGSIFADVDAEFRSRMNSVGGSVGYRMTF